MKISTTRWINILWRRRILQGTALFLGAVWALVEVTSFIVQRYRLTDNIVDLVGVGALLMYPSVLLWLLRARPDPDDLVDSRDVWAWSGNLVIAGLCTGLLFGGQAIGRATETVQVENDAGELESREVPRQELLRAVSIGPFERADPQTTNWLGLALSEALLLDLSQNRFVIGSAGMPAGGAESSKDPGDLPLARRQQIARDANAHYFVAGEVSGTPEAMQVSARVFRTDPMREVARVERIGILPLTEAVDALTSRVVEALELPAERAARAADGPVRALLSESDPAIAGFFTADFVITQKRDMGAALLHLQEALKLDPGFALAAMRLYAVAAGLGNTPEVLRGLELAHQHRERFTEETRCLVRLMHTGMKSSPPAALRVARACVEQFPANTQVRQTYAAYLLHVDDDVEGAIAQHEAVLALGSANDAAWLSIAQLHRQNGNDEKAIAAYQRYLELKPGDATATLALFDLEVRAGHRDAAHERLLDAIALRDDARPLLRSLASMQLREGELEEALATVQPLQESDQIEDRGAALTIRRQVAEARGKMQQALALSEEGIALAAPGTEAVARVYAALNNAETLGRQTGMQRFDELIGAAYPAEDDIARSSREILRLIAALRAGSVEDIARGRQSADEFMQRYGRRDMKFLIEAADARIGQLEGDPARAVRGFAASYASRLRIGIEHMLGEFALLRWWLEAAAASGDAAAGATPARLLERLQPGYPISLLARARFAAATGDQARARELVQQALKNWADADPDYPALLQARELLAELDDALR